MSEEINVSYVLDYKIISEKQYKIENYARISYYGLKSVNKDFYSSGLSLENLLKDLSSVSVRGNNRVYVENLSLLGSFLAPYLVKSGYTYNEKGNSLKPKEFYCIINDQSKFIFLKINLGNAKVINFYNLHLLLDEDMNELSHIFNIDYEGNKYFEESIDNFGSLEAVPEEIVNYINVRLKILTEAVKACFKLNLTKLTITASAWSQWKSTKWGFYQHEFKKPISKEANDIIDSSVAGGWVFVNKKFKGKIIRCCGYDYTSNHSFIMRSLSMPYGEPHIYKNQEEALLDRKYYLRIYKIYVLSAKLADPDGIPFIGLNKGIKTGYDYPEEFYGEQLCLWEEELRRFTTYYDVDFEILKICCFKGARDLFSDYIDKTFSKKEEASEKLKKIEKFKGSCLEGFYQHYKSLENLKRRIAKGGLNPIYGRLITSSNKRAKVPYMNESGDFTYKLVTVEQPYEDRAAGSYISSCARCREIDLVYSDPKRAVYGDTDSCYFLGFKEPDITISDKLGGLKLEGRYSRALFLKPKTYITLDYDTGEIDKKLSGMTEDLKSKISFSNMKEGMTVSYAKRIMKQVKGGVVFSRQDYTFKL